jgi:hypothetical protein
VYFTISYIRGGVAKVWAGKELNKFEGHKMKNAGAFKYSSFDEF